MESIVIFLPFVFLIICVICAFKESKYTGFFRTIGVYGRIAAYLSTLLPLGIIMFIASFFVDGIGTWAERIPMLIAALIGAAVVAWSYFKCPVPYRKRLIPCMLVSGLGVALKISLFFLVFVWKLTAPEVAQLEDGTTVCIDPWTGGVIDPSTGRTGHVDPNNPNRIIFNG